MERQFIDFGEAGQLAEATEAHTPEHDIPSSSDFLPQLAIQTDTEVLDKPTELLEQPSLYSLIQLSEVKC